MYLQPNLKHRRQYLKIKSPVTEIQQAWYYTLSIFKECNTFFLFQTIIYYIGENRDMSNLVYVNSIKNITYFKSFTRTEA